MKCPLFCTEADLWNDFYFDSETEDMYKKDFMYTLI